jgi:hypothetical protein
LLPCAGTAPLKVVDGSELETAGDVESDHVDRGVFGELHGDDEFGNPALYREWFRRNPSIYSFLFSGTRVVGYGNAMPLTDAAFADVLAGTVCDGLIRPEMIRRYDEPGDYKLYLCSIAILPEFRTQTIGIWSLYSSFQRKMEMLRRRGMRIVQLAAVVWTAEGRAICRSFGMKFHRRHVRQGDVYVGDLSDGRFPNELPGG